MQHTTSFVGSQPIFDARGHVVAHELLFRDSQLNRAVFSDPDRACAATLVSALTDIGLDDLLGPVRGFVNVSEGVLLGPYLEGLPSDRITIEVLETVPATPRVIERLRELRALGFQIALDDFAVNDANVALVELADVIKVDVLSLGVDAAARMAKVLAPRGVQLLAEKVESQEVYDRMREAGYALFQGYFFCRPRVVTARTLSPSRGAALQLLAALQDPDADLRRIEEVLRTDVGLSYRLIRAANSSHNYRSRKIDSVRSAIALLGVSAVRSLACLLVLSGAGLGGVSTELLVATMTRARVCERLAELHGTSPSVAFTTGLFSLLDVMLGASMELIVEQLPAMTAVNAALLRREGPAGRYLHDVECYEQGLYERAALGRAELSPIWLEASIWARRALRAASVITG